MLPNVLLLCDGPENEPELCAAESLGCPDHASSSSNSCSKPGTGSHVKLDVGSPASEKGGNASTHLFKRKTFKYF